MGSSLVGLISLDYVTDFIGSTPSHDKQQKQRSAKPGSFVFPLERYLSPSVRGLWVPEGSVTSCHRIIPRVNKSVRV